MQEKRLREHINFVQEDKRLPEIEMPENYKFAQAQDKFPKDERNESKYDEKITSIDKKLCVLMVS